MDRKRVHNKTKTIPCPDNRKEVLSKRLDLSPGESRQVKFQIKKPKHYVLVEIPEARIKFRV